MDSRGKLTALVAALAGTLLGACGQTALKVRAPGTVEAIDAIVTAQMREQGIPGASLVMLKDDEVLVSKGYGLEDLERPGDVPTGDTVYMLNSDTKVFLAGLVMRLAEAGRLSLADPVARHLPEYAQLPPDLTLRQLLDHTSGVREDAMGQALESVFSDPKNLASFDSAYAAYQRGLLPASTGFAPGFRWSYSNTNYVLLTLVVERLLGKPYDQALAEWLHPMGLASLRQCGEIPMVSPRGRARGYIRNPKGEGVVPHPPERYELIRGDGGLCGSMRDLALWMRMLVVGKAVSPASFAQMATPARLAGGGTAEFGAALSLVRPDGATRIGHGGYGSGYSSQVAYYPDAGLTIAIAFNRFAFPEYVERGIARRLLGLPEPTLRELPTPDADLARFAGAYDLGISGWMPAVAARDGRLWLELGMMPPMPLAFLGDGEYGVAGKPDGYRLRFVERSGSVSLRLQGMGLMAWYGIRQQ